MAKGDHLYVSRGTYAHHGIDCGDGTVIHYREGEAITRSARAAFALGAAIFVKPYDLADPADIVVHRAESRLGERDYHVVFNNCEHFASWCKTGKHRSEQVDRVVAASVAGGLVGGVLLGGLFTAPVLAAAGVYGVSKLIEQSQAAKDPVLAQQYLQSAIAQLRSTYSEQQQEINAVRQEADTWSKAARLALEKGREDLARAALAKKYPLKLQLRELEPRLEEIGQLLQQIERQSQNITELPPGSP